MKAVWRIRAGRDFGDAPFLVFGILNTTPDSFYDGGAHQEPDRALAQGRRLYAAGAAVIDVGGVSTRPGAAPVSASEEARRVLPVIAGLHASLMAAQAGGEGAGGGPAAVSAAGLPAISIDTFRATVAAQALEAGAGIVNDVSACRLDPGLSDVLAQYKPGYVLMFADMAGGDLHGRHPVTAGAAAGAGSAKDDVTGRALAFFEAQLGRLVRAGLPEERVLLDPGIGFGKSVQENVQLVAQVGRLASLGRPVLMGLSNKSVFGRLLGREVGQRTAATVAATALAFARGAWAHRVHEVEAAVDALRVAAALAAASG